MATVVSPPPIALDTANLFPWRDIRDVMVAGQSMVFIPKFYVKNMLINGLNAYFVCGTKKSGYHLHPAFYNNGVPTTNGILIGKYLSSGTATALNSIPSINPVALRMEKAFNAINSKNVINGTADETGWHPFNIYEYHLILRLALIEYATTRFENIEEYHGICDWGTKSTTGTSISSKGFWIDGLKAKCEGDASVFKWVIQNKTQSNEVETAQQTVHSKYVRIMTMKSTDDYDLGDLFLVDQEITAKSGSSYGGATQSASSFTVNVTNNFFWCTMLSFTLCHAAKATNSTTSPSDRFVRIAKYC